MPPREGNKSRDIHVKVTCEATIQQSLIRWQVLSYLAFATLKDGTRKKKSESKFI